MFYCEYPSVQDMRVNHGLAKIFAAEKFLDIPKIVAPDIERVENECKESQTYLHYREIPTHFTIRMEFLTDRRAQRSGEFSIF